MKEKKEQTTSRKYLPNQTMLFFKGAIGGYLVYLAYDIISTELLSGSRIGIILASCLFVIAGIALVITTIRSFIRGEYIDGKADITEEEYEKENYQHIDYDDVNDNESERM